MELADFYRPGAAYGARSFGNLAGSPRSSAAEAIMALAAELEIDVADVTSPTQARSQTDRSATVRELRQLAETGEVSAHEMRRQLRAVGIAIGDEREDDEDRRHTARHEAAHAAAALALGWGVKWVDVGRGQTQVEQPTYASRSRGVIDMDAERAVIAASGAAFTGVASYRAELEGDRAIVRQHRTRWEDARREAELMAKDRRVRSLHETLTEALLASPSGRLEGAALGAALDPWIEDWEDRQR